MTHGTVTTRDRATLARGSASAVSRTESLEGEPAPAATHHDEGTHVTREYTWRKSSLSGAGDDCVELRGDLAALGDTKNHARRLEVGEAGVRALVAHVRELPST